MEKKTNKKTMKLKVVYQFQFYYAPVILIKLENSFEETDTKVPIL